MGYGRIFMVLFVPCEKQGELLTIRPVAVVHRPAIRVQPGYIAKTPCCRHSAMDISRLPQQG